LNFVLDTNAASEPLKQKPNPGFLDWYDAQKEAHLFITAINIAEIWNGVHSLPVGHPERTRLSNFAENLTNVYRILNFDQRAAAEWGRLNGSARRPLPLRDSLIAAIALSRGFRIVTRDSAFAAMGCKVVDPWT